ncbi:MAG: UDP-N-acetylmuramoyl-tripeptide--D-alanyl-D-alanine ligase [Bacilli bacterium]
MINIINTLFIIMFLVEFYKNMIIYQQNQYIIKRYVNSLIRKSNFVSLVGVSVTLINYFICNFIVKIIMLSIILIISIVVEHNKHYKLSFKFTHRMKRYFFVTIILIWMVMIFYLKEYSFVLILFSNIIVIIMHYFTLPIENSIRKFYIKKARNKINKLRPFVIGITGSYGKTSSKNILFDILKSSKYVLPTPASFNTPMGLSITINNDLTPLHEVFIAEMGAYVRGEIKENCDIVSPDIGIITSIGTAHLESFGSRENILKGKFELVESLKENGVAILNADDDYLMSYEIKSKCKVLTYSIDKDSDLKAYDLVMGVKGLEFSFNYEDKEYRVKSKLLGRHNVYNILSCLLVSIHLGLNIDKIIYAIKDVNVVPHRLELRQSYGCTIIDDAFNSNPIGAKEAANVLGQMEGYRVAMTPGMIELGQDEYKLNKEFASQLVLNSDFVYIVGKNRAKPFIDEFKELDFINYEVVATVDEGFRKFFSIKKNDKVLLIENDLSDIY